MNLDIFWESPICVYPWIQYEAKNSGVQPKMENQETPAPCTYGLHSDTVGCRRNIIHIYDWSWWNTWWLLCALLTEFFFQIYWSYSWTNYCFSEHFLNTDLTTFNRSKITWARGMYNQYASYQIIKFCLLKQTHYLYFSWRISIFVCDNWERYQILIVINWN